MTGKLCVDCPPPLRGDVLKRRVPDELVDQLDVRPACDGEAGLDQLGDVRAGEPRMCGTVEQRQPSRRLMERRCVGKQPGGDGQSQRRFVVGRLPEQEGDPVRAADRGRDRLRWQVATSIADDGCSVVVGQLVQRELPDARRIKPRANARRRRVTAPQTEEQRQLAREALDHLQRAFVCPLQVVDDEQSACDVPSHDVRDRRRPDVGHLTAEGTRDRHVHMRRQGRQPSALIDPDAGRSGDGAHERRLSDPGGADDKACPPGRERLAQLRQLAVPADEHVPTLPEPWAGRATNRTIAQSRRA